MQANIMAKLEASSQLDNGYYVLVTGANRYVMTFVPSIVQFVNSILAALVSESEHASSTNSSKHAKQNLSSSS
jgi:hypothetical protein